MAVLFWIRLDQICQKWNKLDQNGFLTKDKRTFQLDHRNLVQIGSNQIKLDQIGLNWFKPDQSRSIWFKSDGFNEINWIKLDQIG